MAMKHAGKVITESPLLVGVINLSPESFFKGSVATDTSRIEEKIAEFYAYDVDCLDVGAMSTRPLDIYGGEQASIKQEKERIERILPSLMDIVKSYDLPVAIDTQYQETASLAVDLGVSIINDISGLKSDPTLAEFVGHHDLDLVVMATEEKPGDVCGIDETSDALDKSLELAVESGIDRERIAIDPGFGGWQGRDPSCDLDLLKHFSKFHDYELPIYVGISRKSTVNTLEGGNLPEDRLAGSLILTNWLVNQGAHIIRTHDIKETRLALNVRKNLLNYS